MLCVRACFGLKVIIVPWYVEVYSCVAMDLAHNVTKHDVWCSQTNLRPLILVSFTPHTSTPGQPPQFALQLKKEMRL